MNPQMLAEASAQLVQYRKDQACTARLIVCMALEIGYRQGQRDAADKSLIFHTPEPGA